MNFAHVQFASFSFNYTHTHTHKVQSGAQKQINRAAQKMRSQNRPKMSRIFEFWAWFVVDCLAFLLAVVVVSWFMAKNTLSEPHKNILATIHTHTHSREHRTHWSVSKYFRGGAQSAVLPTIAIQLAECTRCGKEGLKYWGSYSWDTVSWWCWYTYLPSTFAHILHNIFDSRFLFAAAAANFDAIFAARCSMPPGTQWACVCAGSHT